jgi:hypothetical protein
VSLTVKSVESLKKPGRYCDGAGLWLDVTATGRKAWSLRFTFARRARQMGLGAFPVTSLADARAKRDAARKLLDQGIDPIANRHAKDAKSAESVGKGTTFPHCFFVPIVCG